MAMSFSVLPSEPSPEDETRLRRLRQSLCVQNLRVCQKISVTKIKNTLGTFLVVQWLRLLCYTEYYTAGARIQS